MGNIEVWEGLPGSGRENTALKESIELCHSGKRVLWVVDRRVHVQLIEEKALEMARGAIAGFSAIAAGRLAWYLLEEMPLTVSTVDVETRGLLLWESLTENPINKTRKLSDGWAKITVEAYKNLKSVVGKERVTYQNHLQQNYPWMYDTILRYEKLLSENGLLDESDLPVVATNLLNEGARLPWEKVIISRLGPQQEPNLVLLEALVNNLGAGVIFSDHCGEDAPSLHLAKLDFQRWKKQPGIKKRQFPLEEVSHHFATHLFTGKRVENTVKNIGISYNRNILEEVKSVTDSVAFLVHEKQANPSDIAVVCTDLETYLPYLEDFFPKYGLNVFHLLGIKIKNTPIVELVRHLLALRAEGFAPKPLFALLRHPFINQLEGFSDKKIHQLEVLSKLAKIRWGSKEISSSWLEPIKNIPKEAYKNNNITTKETENILAGLSRLSSHILTEFSADSEAPVMDWLEKMLTRFGVLSKIEQLEKEKRSEGEINRLAFSKLYLLDQRITEMSTLKSKNNPGLLRYKELFEKLSGQINVSFSIQEKNGILAVGSLDSKGLRKKHLFFIGVTSAKWPKPVSRNVLDPNGKHVSVLVRQAEYRSLTYELLTNNKNITISVPCPEKSDGEDKPSVFIREMEAAGVGFISKETPINNRYRNPFDLLPQMPGFSEPRREELLQKLAENDRQDSAARWQNINRVIQIEKDRQNPGKLIPHNGYVGKNSLNEWLLQGIIDKPFSVSKLDQYAECPMRFYFDRCLGAAKETEIEDGLEVLEKGTFIHEILAEANRQLREKQLGIGYYNQDTFSILLLCAEAHIDKYKQKNSLLQAMYKELVDGLNGEGEEGTLKATVAKYAEKGFENSIPLFVEASFGMNEEGEDVIAVEPIKIGVDEGVVELVGRIDLVVFNAETGFYLVDYKTGSVKKTGSDSKNGVSFQLPVYIEALRVYLETHQKENDRISGAEFFSLKDSKAVSYDYEKKYLKEIDTVRDLAIKIVKSIKNGYFHQPLGDKNKLCPDNEYNYCPYNDICRKDHSLFARREVEMDLDIIKNAYIPPVLQSLTKRFEEKNNG